MLFLILLSWTARDYGAAWVRPDSTIILLCGIPGDTESENTYHNQLQSWLEVFSEPNRAGKLLVFCDQPGTVKLPAGLDVKSNQADREHFLALAPALAATTNPLVVILWGHGGNQGSTPVLHVRGPRLTPPDLATLAAALPAVPTDWVFLFRGSGSFGRAVAGPGREVLTSDYETPFTSDPIGMSLLLKLVKARPPVSFSTLAEELGRKTAEWYSQRNLARTEEPTLWSESEQPRRLAELTPGPETPKEQVAATPVASPSGNIADPATNQPPAGSPILGAAGWDHIKRVHPEDYAGADAVVLSSRLVCQLGRNPALVTEKDEFIQILTAEGKRFGDFDIRFAPPHEEVEVVECEVQRPEGQITRLDPEAPGDAADRPMGDDQTTRRKFFSLPGAVPGAVLHVHLRSQWKEFPLPQITTAIPVVGESPILDNNIEVRFPKDSPFHFVFEGISAPDPAISQMRYSTVYSWHLTRVASDTTEPLVAPHRRPGLLVSTFSDWHEFATWYSHISRLAVEITPELSAKAHELALGLKNDQEKVKAIYNYVTELRYVAIPLGVNSLRPHAAAKVLENQFGDCKDKANLLNALLHALNIESDLVLVPRFSQAYENLPGLGFNHAISRVKLGDKTLWLDTTDDVCRFGLLPPGDAGRNVLVADGATVSLKQLEMSEPGQHRLSIHGKLSSSDPSAGWSLEVTAVGSGYQDYQLRRTAQEAKGFHSGQPLLEAHFRPFAGSFALQEQTATSVSALDQDFSWHAKGSFVGLASATESRCALHSPFWLPKEWELALNQRRAPLFLNEGYPLSLEEEFEVELPPGTEAGALPHQCENGQQPLRWRIEWTKATKGKLIGCLHADLVRGELSSTDTAAFQRQVRQLLTALASDVALSMAVRPG